MNEKTFMISAVSAKYNIHPQTLRLYEREGLLIPDRTPGNTRVYKDRHLKKLEFILNLTRDMGVNLAGIEIILDLKDKMRKMQEEFERFLEDLKREFSKEGKEDYFEKKKNAIVKVNSGEIKLFKDD
jgi:MerR family transcriptional regulator/heat shock protein HspR